MDDKIKQLLDYLEKYHPDYVKESELIGFGFKGNVLSDAAKAQLIEASSEPGESSYRLTALGFVIYNQGRLQKIAESKASSAIGGYDNTAAYFEDVKMWIRIFIVLAAASVFLGVLTVLRVFSIRII